MPGGLIHPVQEAFDFSQAAIDALDALGAGTGNQAADVAKSDLLDYIFVSARPGRGQRVDPNNQNFRRVRATFNAVKNFGQFQGTFRPEDGAAETDVVVYCDYSRFDNHEDKDCFGREKKGFACDPHIGALVKMDDDYKDCKYEFGIDTDTDIARAENLEIDEQNPRTNVGTLNGNYDKMDYTVAMDHTLLHELTHAIKTEPQNGVFSTNDGPNSNGYGWNAVKAKSSVIAAGDAGFENADSYAFFGLGARMITPSTNDLQLKPVRPMEDGKIDILPPPNSYPSRLRDLLNQLRVLRIERYDDDYRLQLRLSANDHPSLRPSAKSAISTERSIKFFLRLVHGL
ncbi:MAG: hypothetical protein Q9165_000458 [Trypethelium subeluteriae]